MVSTLLYLWGSNAFGQLGMGGEIMERIRPALSSFTNKVNCRSAGLEWC